MRPKALAAAKGESIDLRGESEKSVEAGDRFVPKVRPLSPLG